MKHFLRSKPRLRLFVTVQNEQSVSMLNLEFLLWFVGVLFILTGLLLLLCHLSDLTSKQQSEKPVKLPI